MSNTNYCQPPLQFETNNQQQQRNNNDFIYMSNTTSLTYSDGNNDSIKPAIYMGDGWCTFPDLDNFDSDILLKAFTLKEKDSADSMWDPALSYSDTCQMQGLSISALRQLEALFNLSQLLFGLSRAETVNYTFRDLQLRSHPHSFKKSGFKQLNTEGRIDFYSIFERLVNEIIDAGGLEVTLLIYKNPMLPMVRQKCLDLISNVATVPDVAYKIMRHQMWFLDHLLILVRDGEIVSDKIPALSVLIRLLKVMLIERMISAYMKLVDMQYIDCLVDIFENPEFTESTEFLPFFIKFEFITMQSLTVILGDAEYSQLWSDKAKTRLLNYCMIVLLKASAYPNDQQAMEQINHIFYAEQHSNKHSLAHTIMTVTELLRNDENMKLFYRYHRPFKQLIIQLYKKYGAKSLYIRTDPGISYALNHLMRVLYIKNSCQMPPTGGGTNYSSSASSASNNGSSSLTNVGNKQHSAKNLQKKSNLDYLVVVESSNNNNNNNNNKNFDGCTQIRSCSNPQCKNEETKYKPFKQCSNCDGAVAYCSSKCKKAHISYHLKNECNKQDSSEQQQQQLAAVATKHHAYNRIYSSTSTGGGGNYYQKNNRRTSENLQHINYQEQQQQPIAVKAEVKRRESSTGQELFYQSTTKKMSKFSSMNENHRRNSVVSTMPTTTTNQQDDLNRINPLTKNVYAKRSSMKETKSSNPFRRFSVFDDISNTKLKQQQQQQQDKIDYKNINAAPAVMDDTTASSVYFVRPLKTSTAVCLPDLTRRQSLRDIENLKNKLNSIESTTTSNNQVNKLAKYSDSSSYNSCLSTSTETTHSNKLIIKSKNQQQDQQVVVKKRIKKVSLESDPNSSVHKRRHSATDAILSIETKPKQQHQSIVYNDSSSLFYQGKQLQQPYQQQQLGIATNNQTKTSSSCSKSTSITTNTESTPDSSDPEDYQDQQQVVKVQRYADAADEDEDEEVETERQAVISMDHASCSNERIDSKFSSNLQQKDNFSNNNNNNNNQELFAASSSSSSSYSAVMNEDDQDLRSHCKVVKEFEKTLEFVKNASNLKVMPSLSLNQNNVETLETPSNNRKQQLKKEGNQLHISLASLCYDTQMSKNNEKNLDESTDEDDNDNDNENESDSSESDSDDDSSNDKSEELKQSSSASSSEAVAATAAKIQNGRHLNAGATKLVINNSIESHMLTNNYSLRDHQLQSNNNNDILLNTNSNNNNRNKKMSYNDIKLKSTGKTIKTRVNKDEEEEVEEDEDENEEDEFIDDEFSLFKKNETLHNTYKTSDYKTFKKPLINMGSNESKSASSLHSTKMPIFQTTTRQPSFEFKKNNNNHRNQIFVQKHNTELKIFDNLSVNSNATKQQQQQTIPDLPKNSTPIFTDNATAASLNAKHRQFLNAKLNLTIVPGQLQTIAETGAAATMNVQKKVQSSNNNNNTKQQQVFLVPQIPPAVQQKLSPAGQQAAPGAIYKTSTLKSNSNLIMDSVDSNSHKNHNHKNEMIITQSAVARNKIGHKLMPSDILDVSKISALENATSTNSCVIVAKADMPKDIKKCLKEEIKKDKSKCSIQ